MSMRSIYPEDDDLLDGDADECEDCDGTGEFWCICQDSDDGPDDL